MAAHTLSLIIRRASLAIALLATFATSADAATQETRHRFGNNLFAAGHDVSINDSDVQGVFAAGTNVTVDSQVKDSVRVAGRTVRINGQVGQDIYAAGYNVSLNSLVGGDLIAAGYRVDIASGATVAKDVLAAGRFVTLSAPVTGNAMLAGQNVEIAAPITGSLEIHARNIRFSGTARVDGNLTYYSNKTIEIPATVIDPSRVRAVITPGPSIASIVTIVLTVIAVVLASMFVLALVFALIFRGSLAETRETMTAHPWHNLLFGLIVTGGLFGSIVVLAMSIIGIPLIPLMVILIPFALLAGYFTTAHAIGSKLLHRTPGPTSGFAAFGAILLGTLVLLALQIIPLLGWVITVLAVIIGLGAWFGTWLAPPKPAATITPHPAE